MGLRQLYKFHRKKIKINNSKNINWIPYKETKAQKSYFPNVILIINFFYKAKSMVLITGKIQNLILNSWTLTKNLFK